MFEYFVEFHLIKFGYATGYFYADNVADCKKQVKKELCAWGGGNAGIYDEAGDFVGCVKMGV